MQGKEGRDECSRMNDTFSNFRGFGFTSSLFGGRDPFDDPFFSRPFGSFFEPRRFAAPGSNVMVDSPLPGGDRGLLIQELNSEDEGGEAEGSETRQDNDNTQKNNGSDMEPYVEHPDDVPSGNCVLAFCNFVFQLVTSCGFLGTSLNVRKDYNKVSKIEPQARNFSFQTCKVTYGGVDGAYYTSTRTRRAGNDGVGIEESKEADKRTGQATHRISRGIQDKGHSVTRKLNPDGKVDTMQTLHNLDEDELTGFEEAWNGNIKGQFHGWSDKFGSGSDQWDQTAAWGGWLPSTGRVQYTGEQGRPGAGAMANSGAKTKKVVRINIE